MNIPVASKNVPCLSTEQMIEVDRAMIEDYKIGLIQMMENAGRNLAHLARQRFLNGDPRGQKIIVLAGSGGNGGGALVCARRLHNYGAGVHVFLTKPDVAFTAVPRQQLDILRRMGVPVALAEEVDGGKTAVLIIDGIIGYSLQGQPYGSAAHLMQWANQQKAPILALDIPSGLDATTGTAYELAIRATATMTLALPKTGLVTSQAIPYVGELYLADISVPPALYASPALQLTIDPIFAVSDIVRIQ